MTIEQIKNARTLSKDGGRRIGSGAGTYVIAEIGSNHDQDIDRALCMIRSAAAAGADAVKFQAIAFEKLYSKEHETAKFREWFRAIELNEDWYQDLSECARDHGVDFLCSPTYTDAIERLEACDVPAYKIASPQAQADHTVLRRAARTGKPLIISVGYCSPSEIMAAQNICREEGNEELVFLACTSMYPAPPEETNLRFMRTLSGMTAASVGYSDHSVGVHIAVAAVALGATVIEKHVTTDRSRHGPDHHFSITMEEFADMVNQIRDVEKALGTGACPALSDEVLSLRKNVELKAFAARRIDAGERVGNAQIAWRRFTGEALRESEWKMLPRVVMSERVERGDPISWNSVCSAEGVLTK